MHGLETIIALNARKPVAPRVPYVSYECRPVRVEHVDAYGIEHMVTCEDEEATAWGVYGRRADGTASHVCDCVDEASADSAVALLNALRPAPATAVDPVHTFEGELHETIALYTGARQLSAVERMVLRYAEIIRKHVDADVRAELAAVFPL